MKLRNIYLIALPAMSVVVLTACTKAPSPQRTAGLPAQPPASVSPAPSATSVPTPSPVPHQTVTATATVVATVKPTATATAAGDPSSAVIPITYSPLPGAHPVATTDAHGTMFDEIGAITALGKNYQVGVGMPLVVTLPVGSITFLSKGDGIWSITTQKVPVSFQISAAAVNGDSVKFGHPGAGSYELDTYDGKGNAFNGGYELKVIE